MRYKAVLVLTVVLAGGCTSTPAPASAPAPAPVVSEIAASSAPGWTEPAAYTFTLERHCNRGPAMGTYAVTVAGGEVVRAERIGPPAASASAASAASGEEEIDVPTLAELIEIADTAAEDGAEVTARYDPADGHPVDVTINAGAQAVDGASCFTVTAYKPA